MSENSSRPSGEAVTNRDNSKEPLTHVRTSQATNAVPYGTASQPKEPVARATGSKTTESVSHDTLSRPKEPVPHGTTSQPTKPPTYRRMKRKGRPDSACCYVNGKRILLGLYGSPESRQKFAEVVGGVNVLTPLADQGGVETCDPPSNPTISEILVAFLEYAQAYYGQTDSKEYAAYLDTAGWLRRDAGLELAKDYGPKRLKLLRDLMIAEEWKRKTINGQIKRIVRIFRWAVSEEMLEPEVHQKLATVENLKRGRSAAVESTPVLPVDDATVKATIKKLPQVVGDMVRFQRLTGCRPGEMTILRPCDVDRAGEVWFYTPDKHKTEHHGHSRTIAIGPKAQEILLRYLARDVQMYCFCPGDSEEKRLSARHAARVTPMSCGNVPSPRATRRSASRVNHYSVDSYRQAVKRAAKRAGVEPWTPHRLRHSAATEVRKEFGLDSAQSMLGHKSASITEVYAELDKEKAAAVARKIG